MKETWKRVRMKTLQAKAGFTLVELIVVIAILGILAGVAVPVYSGYVKKANMAADQTLVDSINTAFAAACIEHGYNVNEVDAANAKLDIDDNTMLLVYESEDCLVNKDVTDSFKAFFGTNSNSKFKVYKMLTFQNGMFVGEPGVKVVTVGEWTFEIKESSITNFKNATAFSQHVDDLQVRVDNLSKAYTEVVGGDIARLQSLFGDGYIKYLNDNNIAADEMGNATVLYVAEKSAGMTAQNAYDQLLATKMYLNQNPSATIDDYMAALSVNGDALATTAMLYGAVTAYVNGPGEEDTALRGKLTDVHDAGTLLSLITAASGNDGFLAYCSDAGAAANGDLKPSEQFTIDMNGYLGALDGINTSADAFKGDLNNNGTLWQGDNAETLLNQLLGNN